MNAHHHYRHYRSPLKRGVLALVFISSLMTMGTLGMRYLEGYSYLDAFYFMSMIATAQGPVVVPQTAAGKIFASLMAFVSVGGGVAALGFLFGPFFGKIWRIGVEHLEEELRRDREGH